LVNKIGNACKKCKIKFYFNQLNNKNQYNKNLNYAYKMMIKVQIFNKKVIIFQ